MWAQVLACQDGGELVTGDAGCAVMLGRLPDAVLQRFGEKLKAGTLLRLRVGPGGFTVDESGNVCGADLHLVGVANQMRQADLLSRILFQWQLRNQQVSMQNLADRVRVDYFSDELRCYG